MDKIKTKNRPYDGLELLPPKGDPEVGVRGFQIFTEVLNDKIDLGLHDKFNRNNELFRNKHWRSKGTSAVPLISANLLFVHIQRTTNELTDNNPTFNISRITDLNDPESQFKQGQFDDLQHAADHWWTDQEQQDVLDTSVRAGELNGITIEKTIFNPDLEGGLGEIEAVNVDAFHFGWYPVKLKDPRKLQQCEATLHFYPMTIREAKRRWPDSADKIKPDEDVWKELGDERREVAGQDSKKDKSLMVTIASTVKELLNYITGSTSLAGDEILAIEIWCHDYSKSKKTEEVKGDQYETSLKETTEYLYPGNIRQVTLCNGGKVVLEDRRNPCINWASVDAGTFPMEEAKKTYLWDKYPFSACNSVKDITNAWGISDIEQLEWLNIELDKAISQFVLYKDKASRLKIINPMDSGVEDDDFDNYPGTIRPSNAMAAAGIRYMETPPSPIDYDKAIQLFKDMFFLVAGTFEMDQAATPGRQVIAFKAIAALLERAATMKRGKIRSYSRLIRERGRSFISHVQNFYTEDRWITYQEDNGLEQSKQINGKNLRIPAKLTVVTGSTLPTSRIQMREEAVGLYKEKAIDQADLLDKIEWPNRNQVLERMKIGPLGEAMQKLNMIGVPKDLTDIFTKAIAEDPQKLQKNLETGKFPTFSQLFEAMVQDVSGQAQEQPEDEGKTIELQKVAAETQKIMAETKLIMEQTNTEKVDQAVRASGVDFDKEKLTMERAKTVKDIEQSDKANTREDFKAVSGAITSAQKNSPGYNESGMKSNNKGKS